MDVTVTPRSLSQELAAFAATTHPSGQIVEAVKAELIASVTASLRGFQSPQDTVVKSAWPPDANSGERFGDDAFAAVRWAVAAFAGAGPNWSPCERAVRTVVIPATTAALRPSTNSSGADLCAALAVGSEVVCRLYSTVIEAFEARRLPAYTVLGPLGAAVAVNRLEGASAQQIADAIGVACSVASGVEEIASSDAAAFLAGWAAQSGTLAGDLAAGGFLGPTESIEGPRGLFRAFVGHIPLESGDVVRDLGTTWRLLEYTSSPPSTAELERLLDTVVGSTRGSPIVASLRSLEATNDLLWLRDVIEGAG